MLHLFSAALVIRVVFIFQTFHHHPEITSEQPCFFIADAQYIYHCHFPVIDKRFQFIRHTQCFVQCLRSVPGCFSEIQDNGEHRAENPVLFPDLIQIICPVICHRAVENGGIDITLILNSDHTDHCVCIPKFKNIPFQPAHFRFRMNQGYRVNCFQALFPNHLFPMEKDKVCHIRKYIIIFKKRLKHSIFFCPWKNRGRQDSIRFPRVTSHTHSNSPSVILLSAERSVSPPGIRIILSAESERHITIIFLHQPAAESFQSSSDIYLSKK